MVHWDSSNILQQSNIAQRNCQNNGQKLVKVRKQSSKDILPSLPVRAAVISIHSTEEPWQVYLFYSLLNYNLRHRTGLLLVSSICKRHHHTGKILILAEITFVLLHLQQRHYPTLQAPLTGWKPPLSKTDHVAYKNSPILDILISVSHSQFIEHTGKNLGIILGLYSGTVDIVSLGCCLTASVSRVQS